MPSVVLRALFREAGLIYRCLVCTYICAKWMQNTSHSYLGLF